VTEVEVASLVSIKHGDHHLIGEKPIATE